MGTSSGHDQELLARLQAAVHDAHQGHHADEVVEPGIDDERLQRSVGIALGRRYTLDQFFQQVRHTDTGLGADPDGVGGASMPMISSISSPPCLARR